MTNIRGSSPKPALLVAAVALTACGPDSNSGDCADTLLAGDLVITEVFADAKAPPGGSGTDDGKEWFEIYNNTDNPVELKGLTVTHSRPDGSKAKSHTMKAITIAPGQFFTLGNSADDLLPPYVDYGFGADLGDFFNTDGGQLKLSCGSAEIDSAIYESVKEGHSRQLTAAQPPDYQLNDVATNWCEADATEFEDSNFGTPGSDNDCQPIVIGQCSDGGTMRDTVPPLPGDLVITEIMPNPKAVSDTVGEWFEVYATRDVDFNGVGLDRAGDNNVAPKVIEDTNCVSLASGEYGLFVKSDVSSENGGLPAAAIKGKFTFALVDGTVAAPGDVRLMYGADVIDSVSWETSTDGSAIQLDPDDLSATANDDPTNRCNATVVYNTVATNMDFGTPGAANTQCGSAPQPGNCFDTTLQTNRPIVKPTAGQIVITEFLANPAGTVAGVDAAQEWFEVKNTTGASWDLNGLGLKGNATTINTITSGDCKPVAGGQYALFAHNTTDTMNGGLPAVDATFTFALGQTAGQLSVLDGATVLDNVTWTTAWPVDDGKSNQTKNNVNETMNDTMDNWCQGLATYSTMSANLGTPKMPNTCP